MAGVGVMVTCLYGSRCAWPLLLLSIVFLLSNISLNYVKRIKQIRRKKIKTKMGVGIVIKSKGTSK